MDGWISHKLDMTNASALFSSLCRQDVWFKLRASLDRSTTVSVAMKNIFGEFFHHMERVIGIATRYSPLLAEGENNPSFGAYPGRSGIR